MHGQVMLLWVSSDVFSWNCRKWDRRCIGKEGSAKAPVRLEPIIKVTQEHVKTCIKNVFQKRSYSWRELVDGLREYRNFDPGRTRRLLGLWGGGGGRFAKGAQGSQRVPEDPRCKKCSQEEAELGALLYTCVKVQALCELLLVNGAQRVNQF